MTSSIIHVHTHLSGRLGLRRKLLARKLDDADELLGGERGLDRGDVGDGGRPAVEVWRLGLELAADVGDESGLGQGEEADDE